MSTKQERVEHVNELIKAISSYGRKFFWCESKSRTASMQVDDRGRVWFIDDYTGERIYTHYDGRWRGFSHGGTLKRLVERMRDYVRTGKKISILMIAPNRGEIDGDHDMWGYGLGQCVAVRRAVCEMPIIS